MKLAIMAAGTLLVLGLGTAAYAEPGKCGGSGMGEQSMSWGGAMPFQDKKAMCLTKIDTMEKCVKAATNNAELDACKTAMMEKMQSSKKRMKNGENKPPLKGKCGSGKCGGK